MPSKRDHSKCQTCGLEFSNDALMAHELSCLARTQENSEIIRSLEVDKAGTSDKIKNSGFSSDSFSEEGEDNDNFDSDDDVSDSEMFRLLETDTAGTSDKKANSASSSDSFSKEGDDDNSSEEDVSDSEMFLRSKTDTAGTSDKKANSASSSDSFSEEEADDSSGKDDVSDSEMFRLLVASRRIGLRGGGGGGEGSKSPNLQSNPGPSQERRRPSLVTPTFRYDRQKPENLFPPTKKYRYYPVTCEYCGKRFQPNKLKAHKRKHHLSETDEVKPTKRVQSAPPSRKQENKPSTSRSKSAGGIPRQLQVCYICGQLYGSRSLKIHEPKCLDKWRIQNQQLPPDLRAPEPVKPEAMAPVGTGKEGYDLPAFDPKAEAAFRSHLSTLIPCRHCSRTFSPDRIQTHMSCCIERPRTRESVTPTKGGKSEKKS